MKLAIELGHSSRGLGLGKEQSRSGRLRVTGGGPRILDTNLTIEEIKKIRWYARKEDRSTASLVRIIVRDWLKQEEMAGEFKGYKP